MRGRVGSSCAHKPGFATIQLGGCDGKVPSCLPIMEGWNDTVRLFLRREILDGAWRFPESQPVASEAFSKWCVTQAMMNGNHP